MKKEKNVLFEREATKSKTKSTDDADDKTECLDRDDIFWKVRVDQKIEFVAAPVKIESMRNTRVLFTIVMRTMFEMFAL